MGLKGKFAVLMAAAVFWCLPAAAAWGGPFLDYLYVEANDGDSSGGHVALRLGDEVFHFQHEPPGILRLQRNDPTAFHHAYAGLGNRAIHQSRIAIAPETYQLLRDAFVRLQLVQGAQLDFRDALQRDVELFDLLLRQRRDPDAPRDEILLPLEGAGYFLAGTPPAEEPSSIPATAILHSPPSSAALRSLRDRVLARYGPGFIEERRGETVAQLRALELRAAAAPVAELQRDRFPPFHSTVSTRYHDSARALVALQLLQAAPALREGTFWSPESDLFRMEPGQLLVLRGYAAELEDELVRLAGSRRGDWAFPFLLGMARLCAIEATLATGRLVLLDIFPPDATLPPRYDRALRSYLPAMRNEMRDSFLRKRNNFLSSGVFREAEYAVLERAGNLLLDVERAMTTGSPLRGVPKSTFPARQATVRVPRPAATAEGLIAGELAAARRAEEQYSALLERLYGYDLLRRNCVTELFAVINAALKSSAGGGGGEADAAVRAESERRLGGFVDPARGLGFIPIVSAGLVEDSYAVVETRDTPSYRSARVAGMKARGGGLGVFLRECNTVTSTVYRRGPGDSAFIFFTDDTVLLRPLFGAFNLVSTAGEGLLGLLTLPVEGPQRLISGARGVLFSLPELLFVNLRKGSIAYVEQGSGDW